MPPIRCGHDNALVRVLRVNVCRGVHFFMEQSALHGAKASVSAVYVNNSNPGVCRLRSAPISLILVLRSDSFRRSLSLLRLCILLILLLFSFSSRRCWFRFLRSSSSSSLSPADSPNSRNRKSFDDDDENDGSSSLSSSSSLVALSKTSEKKNGEVCF